MCTLLRLAGALLALNFSFIQCANAEPIDFWPNDQGIDCAGAAPEAEPGTPEWITRDLDNMFCAIQRHLDQAQHPTAAMPLSTAMYGVAPMPLADAYRDPARHADQRFRFDALTITNRSGETLAAELYRPCAPGTCSDMPAELKSFEPPYPAVVILHGGGSRKELHWWSSQTLAEAGYMVVAFDGAAGNRENAQDVIEWLLASAELPTAAGEFNPHASELNRAHIGLAGHSIGGQTASVLGQEDARVNAVVAWDRGSRLQLPEVLDTPSLFFVGEYECQENPICLPEPTLDRPQGEGPVERGQESRRGGEYDIVHAAGVDAMKITLRASTHLEWTPSEPAGNRYAEIVSVYYTLAWFDRYLKGARDAATAEQAYARLTAPVFDNSADRHNISQGFYDPLRAAEAGDLYAGNVPYQIAGMAVADRLSFYYPSKCDITAPQGYGRAETDDMRQDGCMENADIVTGHLAAQGGSMGWPMAMLLMVLQICQRVRSKPKQCRRSCAIE